MSGLVPQAGTGAPRFADLAVALFDGLGAEVPYAIPRNYRGLPFVKPGHDIDLLVGQDRRPAEARLLDAARRVGATRVTVRANAYVRRYRVHGCHDEQTGQPWCEVDLITACAWKGFVWLDTERVLAERMRAGDVYVPRPADRSVINLFHGLLYGGRVNRRQAGAVHDDLLAEPEQAQAALADPLGCALAARTVALVMAQDWDGLDHEAGKLRRALAAQALRRAPVGAAWCYVRHHVLEARSRFLPESHVALVRTP